MSRPHGGNREQKSRRRARELNRPGMSPGGRTVMSTYSKGLEGVIAAETNMSFIDGQAGVLEYVGIPIGDLSANSSFEETVFLLWNTRLPTQIELDQFKAELRGSYQPPAQVMANITRLPKDAQPMHVLRTQISELALYDPDPNANDVHSVQKKAIKVLGAAPALVAAFDRHRRGLDPIKPDASLSFAENFLYMLNGERATETMRNIINSELRKYFDDEDTSGGENARLFGFAETYKLSDGDTLVVSVNGDANETATFQVADFVDITVATAAEVALVINTDIAGVTA
ncbi:MAG: hypothetical protein IIC31_10120, partial [Chloroflexi bacterium]|nr:hypothetical protein [Chloroflexota bacterium]